MTLSLPTPRRTAAVQDIATAADAGSGAATIEVRTGARPATGDDAATGTVLATFTCADPAFQTVSSGVATLDTTPVLSVAASATGTAGWFRMKDSSGTTVLDGSVTATGGGGDLTLNTVSISSGATVEITAGTVTMPSG